MIKVGIVDSGFRTMQGYGASFYNDGRMIVDETDHQCKHGRIIASLIEREGLVLYSAKVFHASLKTSPQQVAKALDYLIEHNVSLIHMSLGMLKDHAMVRERCELFLAHGGIIVASTPTQGHGEVYPASYSGVIRVCADGRCEGNQINLLEHIPLRLGASPISSDPVVRGSSVAAARVSGIIASSLLQGVSPQEFLKTLFKKGQE
ncbi:MAG: hypothetical protein WA099_04790 [Sulfuricurvum sp.]